MERIYKFLGIPLITTHILPLGILLILAILINFQLIDHCERTLFNNLNLHGVIGMVAPYIVYIQLAVSIIYMCVGIVQLLRNKKEKLKKAAGKKLVQRGATALAITFACLVLNVSIEFFGLCLQIIPLPTIVD